MSAMEAELEVRRDLAVLQDGKEAPAVAAAINARVRAALDRIAEGAARADVDADEERTRLLNLHRQLKLDLRNANIAYERAQAQLQKAQRDELLGGRAGRNPARTDFSDAAALSAAKEITAGLNRTHRLLMEQIDHSQNVHEVLLEGSHAIRKTGETFAAIGATSSQTNRAQARIRRRERTDRLLIALGFIFYLLVVIYVFHNRVGLRFWSIIEFVLRIVMPDRTNVPADNTQHRDL
ncbi:Vesicle transport v-SNARE N-terminal domain-containing protein [Plasmodiophora brassicae]